MPRPKFEVITEEAPERAILVGIDRGNADWPLRESMAELERLANTAGAEVVHTMSQRLDAPNPRTFIGAGKAEELARCVHDLHADVVILDDELSPSQQSNLERIVGNEGSEEDIELLEELSDTISHTALCGLGQSACKPVQSTLRYFREDYERHVRDKFCPLCNGKPKVLQIDPEKCKGCSLCARNCPVEAITGEIKKPFVIDTEKCIRCNACVKNCKFGAIREV